jgi:ribosomal protein S18 acetylase RimI-like enzyme
MEYSFDICIEFGEIFISDDRNACALYLYPHLKRATLHAIWLDIKLIFKAIGIGGIGRSLNREGQIKKLQPKEPMAYLWFIGVNPIAQRSGIGSKLLQGTIELADAKQLPVLLETSTIENIPWYKHFGFTIYNQLDLGYKLYFLHRKLDKY